MWWERSAGWTDPQVGRVRGRPLRYLLTMAMRESGRPMSVRELVAHCERAGVVFEGRGSKVVSDSLRWEVARGRVQRLRRGVYCFGKAPRSTLRFIARRTAALISALAFRPRRGAMTGLNSVAGLGSAAGFGSATGFGDPVGIGPGAGWDQVLSPAPG